MKKSKVTSRQQDADPEIGAAKKICQIVAEWFQLYSIGDIENLTRDTTRHAMGTIDSSPHARISIYDYNGDLLQFFHRLHNNLPIKEHYEKNIQ